MPQSFGTHASPRHKSVQQPLRVIEIPFTSHRSTIVICTGSHLKLQCGKLCVTLVFSKTAARLHVFCRPCSPTPLP
eukprot:2521278-Pyramimonas_sp.AAC.1